jgi:acetate CoA/acetoacetate CoA-transferase alpha subunit
MDKFITVEEAVAKIKDGMTIMVGGFLGAGTPNMIINALAKSNVKNLTLICNDTAYPDKGVGQLIVSKQVAKVITSHIGTNPMSSEYMNSGEIKFEFVPQGTLIERIRCGGAGLGGFLTETGMGTIVAEGKTVIESEGKKYLLEKPLKADIALISAHIGDKSGNLVYRGTSQNFNPIMATAATLVIAAVEHVLEVGSIEPEQVRTPAIFVDFLVKSKA